MDVSGKGQASLEYLLVFSVSISILVFILPVISNVQSTSEDVVKKSYLRSLAWDVSGTCDRLAAVGIASSTSLSSKYPVKIALEGEKITVASCDGSLKASSEWSGLCSLDGKEFGKGESISILFPKQN